MNFKYNEKLYAETIIKEEKFQTDFIKSELIILVKYLKQEKKYTKKQTEEFLYNFCKKHISGYNEVEYFKVIDNAVRNGRKNKNKLIIVENIPILNKELEYLDGLDIDNEYKKLLLSFIVNKKINYKIHSLIEDNIEMSAYFGGTNRTYKQVFNQANIKGKYKIDDMITELVKEGLVSSIIEGDIVLDFLCNIYPTKEEIIEKKNWDTEEIEKIVRKHIIYKEPKEEDIFMTIKNFDNIGYVFEYYKGNNKIKFCSECGNLIRANNSKTKYCKSCAEKIERENHKERNRKWYKNKNSDEIEK